VKNNSVVAERPVALPPAKLRSLAMLKYRRSKQAISLKDRLASFTNEARKGVTSAAGTEKYDLLRKTRQANIASSPASDT
jgi:hypothetical protein